jgi:hypothetical protein
VLTGVTFDEVWTLDTFVPQSVLHIINYTPCDANNHILNTLLIKLFFVPGNHSLCVARLPNVIAFIFYLYFAYKIAYKYLSPLLGLCCYILLIFNPFLLDFFGIARGYGLALGLQLISLYFVVTFIKERKSLSALGAIGFGSFAVLSNFSWLNYWLAIVFIINAVPLFYRERYDFKRTFFYSFFPALILIAIIYEPVKKLRAGGSLYYGGFTGFYSDTLVSLTKYSLYSPNIHPAVYITLNIFLALLAVSIIISFAFKPAFLSLKNVFLFITLFCIASVIAQHYLLGTFYLIDRTALFFYPLFIFCLCFALNDFSDKWYSKIIIAVTAASLLNFFNNANLYKTATWYFDAHSSEILSWLNETGKEENRKLKIDFSWPFQNSFRYYFRQNGYPYLVMVKSKEDREDLNPQADYYVYLARSLEKVGYESNKQKIISLHKDMVKEYKNEGIVIFSNLSNK